MAKYNVPTRKYSKSEFDKKMISIRMPEPLIEQLDKWARRKGVTVSDLMTLVLDQFIQFEEKSVHKKDE